MDSRIPWWLVVLLGIGVAGLAVWQSTRWRRQFRLGGGALALIYMALLAMAVGGNSNEVGNKAEWRWPEILLAGSCGVALVAAMLLTGRPSFRGQLIWFGVMSLANVGVCLASGNAGIGSVVAATAVPVMVLLFMESAGGGLSFPDLWPEDSNQAAQEPPSTIWLAGLTGLLLAVVLIGTTFHALHGESSRATTSRRLSALPTRSRIRTELESDLAGKHSTNLADILVRRRSDVLLLLAILTFVSVCQCSRVRKQDETT